MKQKKIHSINSVVIKDNCLKGYNTDGKAAMLSIEKFYKISADDHVVILGVWWCCLSNII